MIPETDNAWLTDIAEAYADALESVPFGNAKEDLFHLGPLVSLKRRGLKATEKRRKLATEGALASYVSSAEQSPDEFSDPTFAFVFCYLASHFALDLLPMKRCDSLIQMALGNLDKIDKMAQSGSRGNLSPSPHTT
ncbi:MAG: hypothetical protein PHI97_27365 [Desulfobulbus sp.]|nr:hypothetical protein [Desulfobulbus sp.]